MSHALKAAVAVDVCDFVWYRGKFCHGSGNESDAGPDLEKTHRLSFANCDSELIINKITCLCLMKIKG